MASFSGNFTTTGYFQNQQPTVDRSIGDSTTTGSFQNQPPTENRLAEQGKVHRKRGISAVLSDIANTDVQPRRRSRVVAEERVKVLLKTKQPRGDASLGGITTKLNKEKNSTNTTVSGEQAAAQTPDVTAVDSTTVKTLQQLIAHDEKCFTRGSELVDDYAQKNISPEVNKGMALKIFITAVSKWNEGIMDAAQRAADVLDISVWTVHKWTVDFYMAI